MPTTMTHSATMTNSARSETDATETDATDRAGLRWAVCPHPWEAHDRIGLRYRNATAAGSLSRGCVCVGATVQE